MKRTITVLIVGVLLSCFSGGCGVYYKVTGKEVVKVTKPRKRYRPFNPKIDKRRKRVKTYRMINN